jgi:hypothetical protein
LEKVWKRFSGPAHCSSAAQHLNQITAHRPNGAWSTRPPTTCLSTCALRQAEKLTAPPVPIACHHPPTERRPHMHRPPHARIYPLHLPLDEAKKLFPSSFPCSPSSASLSAREAVTTLCCVCRAASGTGCRCRRGTTPRLKSRPSS